MQFSRETLNQEFFDVGWPLFERHYLEISANQDIPLKPQFDKYAAMEAADLIRLYTIRLDGGLCGYGIYFINFNMHYADSKQAVQDVLFMEKHLRKIGMGKRFIDYCDGELSREGVQVVYQHVKTYANFGPMLETLGYRHVEHIYSRRLDMQ